MSRKTVGSLFAGIGGFDLSFERHGFEVRWQVEIDRNCQTVLAHHWPDVPRYDDVRECGAHNLEPVDIITFGSPCQDLSVAGKRAGLDGERSGLFHEAIRIIRELRPEFAVWENVAGALSSHHGRDFGTALDALAECGAVDIGWRVLDAKHFGVPQRRRRVFVVADYRGHRAGQILFESEGVRRNSETSGTERQDVAGTLGGGSGQRGWASDTDRMTFIAGTVSAKWAKGTGGPAGDEAQNLIVWNHRQITSGANRWRVEPGLPAPTLTGDGTGHGTPIISFTNRGTEAGSIAETLRAGSHGALPMIGHVVGVRRLTPRECERLQGFPDDWSLVENEPPLPVNRRTRDKSLHGKPKMMTDSARYRMIGNAVALPVIEWIAVRINAAQDAGD